MWLVQACCNLQIFKRKILKLQNTQSYPTFPVLLKDTYFTKKNLGVLRMNKNPNSSLSRILIDQTQKRLF